jgi:hypothetical protein
MYYRGKLASTFDQSASKFHRTYTPQKIHRKMTRSQFNNKVYSRFEEFLSNKNSKVQEKILQQSQIKTNPVKIPKGSRLEKEKLTFHERSEEFQFMRREKLRFLKKNKDKQKEETMKSMTFKPKTTEWKTKKITRELEDLFLWNQDKKEKIKKLKLAAEKERQEQTERETSEIKKKKEEIAKRNKKNKRRMKKRPVSSNVTDRYMFLKDN